MDKSNYSPTDLNNFVSCKYHIKNDLLKDELKLKKKEKNANLKLRIEYGIQHEANHFELLKTKHKKHITINPNQSAEKKCAETIEALKDGYDLIYKAYFVDNNFRGEVDFLLKTQIKSKLGDYSYEVHDTKITKNLRPKHILQITGYSYLLSKIQGFTPIKMYLIDGANLIHDFKVSEFLDYFLYTKDNFEKFLPTVEKIDLYPEKCSFCNICPWFDECEKVWVEDNYINQICGINVSQITKLKKKILEQ